MNVLEKQTTQNKQMISMLGEKVFSSLPIPYFIKFSTKRYYLWTCGVSSQHFAEHVQLYMYKLIFLDAKLSFFAVHAWFLIVTLYRHICLKNLSYRYVHFALLISTFLSLEL